MNNEIKHIFKWALPFKKGNFSPFSIDNGTGYGTLHARVQPVGTWLIYYIPRLGAKPLVFRNGPVTVPVPVLQPDMSFEFNIQFLNFVPRTKAILEIELISNTATAAGRLPTY